MADRLPRLGPRRAGQSVPSVALTPERRGPPVFGDKEPGEPALPITLSDCGGSQRQPALACPDDR
jgi:hypothetical protein